MSWAPSESHPFMSGRRGDTLLASRRVAARYGVAVVAVVVTLALKTLTPLVGELHPLVLLPLGIAVAAWYGGLGPGIAATIGSVIGTDVLFIPPTEFGVSTDVVGLLALAIEGAFISWITVGLRQARETAQAAALAADRDRREAALALEMREELITLWTAKLRGPLSDFATTVDAARAAHLQNDHVRVGLVLEHLHAAAGLMRRTVEHWHERDLVE